jgi:hypothetical protein
MTKSIGGLVIECPENVFRFILYDYNLYVSGANSLRHCKLFKAWWLHAPTGLKTLDLTFCSTVFMFFVFISQQTTSAPRNMLSGL